MEIKNFKVEEWMGKWEMNAKYNIAETCVDSITLNELLIFAKKNREQFIEESFNKRLTYGHITGLPKFLKGVSELYKTLKPENIITTHGAAGANYHIFLSLVSSEDEIVTVIPTYQQLYSIPASLGACVKTLSLEKEDNYQINIEKLRNIVTKNTKVICLNNPNNPTGMLISKENLIKIVEIAKNVGAYVICDEVYRHLTQNDQWSESIADLYDKGISIGSMSKVFSLAGIRLGWIGTKNKEVIEKVMIQRDYNLISCGIFDEIIGAMALEVKDLILERNKKIIRENLEILDNWINQEKHFNYIKPQGGTTALIYYDFNINSEEFCRKLYEKTGVFVVPGECFDIENCFRIGYAANKEILKKGLSQISNFTKTFLGI